MYLGSLWLLGHNLYFGAVGYGFNPDVVTTNDFL